MRAFFSSFSINFFSISDDFSVSRPVEVYNFFLSRMLPDVELGSLNLSFVINIDFFF